LRFFKAIDIWLYTYIRARCDKPRGEMAVLNTQGRQRRAALYLVTLLGCLLAFLSFQSPAYAQCGVDWSCETVDSGGDVGLWTSLAFGPSGPAISYWDQTNDDLKLARYGLLVGGAGQPVDLEPYASSGQSAGGTSNHTSVALWIGLASALVVGGGILLIKRRRVHQA